MCGKVALVVKNLPANAGDMREAGSIPGSGRSPGGGHGNPLQYSCLENPMDIPRSLMGYSPWGRKELDTTERLHLLTYVCVNSKLLIYLSPLPISSLVSKGNFLEMDLLGSRLGSST